MIIVQSIIPTTLSPLW